MTSILVIEDVEQMRDNIAEILEYEDYTVFKAENGRVGVESARNHLPDLIICDVMMPEMDGHGVLLELRSQPNTASIPFIFLTALSDLPSIRSGMNLGADDYLTKPHTTNQLIAAVAARLEKRTVIEHMHQQNLDELRGNLIRMLPHELRTPLSAILGNADYMTRDSANLGKNDIHQLGEEIGVAGRRLHQVIENYLLYAQTELIRYDPTHIETYAKHRCEIPGTLLRDIAGVRVSKQERANDLSVLAEDVVVCISAENLKKIIEELVDNALKFSTSGTPIEITGKSNDGKYTLSIRDQGRGMTVEQISRIGAYMQFERKIYEQQGLGLGLILAKRLAELYSDELTIVSELGHGTTVSIQLQVAS
ncbi:MAG: hybrid sensor histidine kinase/response regulator [Anaerolineae bacterium]|nr:hybrid sensor histidine kinase/response regulator [Anaerolineae bacterium]